jgi:uncharacterized membrane protein
VCLAASTVLLMPPLAGWPTLVRLWAVFVPAFFLVVLACRPWQWQPHDWEAWLQWEPSRRAITIGASAAALVLFWIIFTRFQSGHINGVDFTVYFDRPLFQTSRGRPFFVEVSDQSAYSHLTHLAVHGYWILLPLAALYLVAATPIWLLALSVISVVAGSVHILRIGLHRGFGGLLACATAIAFLLNDNTARALNYGFHAELLYAWFVPWLLDAGLRGHRLSFLAVTIACMLVKEDAVLPLFAVSATLALVAGRQMTSRDRLLYLVAPTALALVNLAAFHQLIVPAIAPGGLIMYSNFWLTYGASPFEALRGMIGRPWTVLSDAATSGFLPTVMPPHLFLPLLGWRWTLGAFPIVLIFGASDSEMVRGFGIYYAIVLVPFLVLGASEGALTIARWIGSARAIPAPSLASAIVVLAAMIVGPGYTVMPWKGEVTAVPQAIERLSDERIVLVQSGLYPHAGYDERVQLLTPRTLRNPANIGAAALIAPRVSHYPFRRRTLACLAELPVIAPMPDGLMAVRVVPLPTDAIAGPDPSAPDRAERDGKVKWERSCDQ